MPSSKAKHSYSTKGGANPGGGRNMTTSRDYSVNLSVQQVLSLWVQGTTLQHFTEMWYWVFLWCLFSSLFLHGAAGLLMLVMLQRHKRGRLITLVLVSAGFLASLSGGVITSESTSLLHTFHEARRWRGCTAWRGRTWRRWRPWCSAWARPPSPSSYPSHASSPLCEAEPPLDELQRRRGGDREPLGAIGRGEMRRTFLGGGLDGRRTHRHPQLLDSKAMFCLGGSGVASLLRANSLLWDIQMPLYGH
uniref:Transmembrane protein 170B n=1 Tax=Gasterosteus aculeatus aculeatus TaxID=481459 RepID=A0AAQ4RJE9_GASAC